MLCLTCYNSSMTACILQLTKSEIEFLAIMAEYYVAQHIGSETVPVDRMIEASDLLDLMRKGATLAQTLPVPKVSGLESWVSTWIKAE